MGLSKVNRKFFLKISENNARRTIPARYAPR
jgi:hypothetical protein